MTQATSHSITSRRSIIAALAAAPLAAAAAPALAAEHDPIPALIEAHRAAYAEMEAAKAARSSIEDQIPTYQELEAQGVDPVSSWFKRAEALPGYREAVNRSSVSMKVEEQAFRALLGAAVNHPQGFMQLAQYACDLTEEIEGWAGEGASPAYRLLAAFAGRDCWTELDGEMHPAA